MDRAVPAAAEIPRPALDAARRGVGAEIVEGAPNRVVEISFRELAHGESRSSKKIAGRIEDPVFVDGQRLGAAAVAAGLGRAFVDLAKGRGDGLEAKVVALSQLLGVIHRRRLHPVEHRRRVQSRIGLIGGGNIQIDTLETLPIQIGNGFAEDRAAGHQQHAHRSARHTLGHGTQLGKFSAERRRKHVEQWRSTVRSRERKHREGLVSRQGL